MSELSDIDAQVWCLLHLRSNSPVEAIRFEGAVDEVHQSLFKLRVELLNNEFALFVAQVLQQEVVDALNFWG